MQKKILFVTKYYSPHIGGVETHLSKVIQTLTTAGKYKIDVVTERYSPKLPTLSVINDAQVHRIDYIHLKYLGILSLWYSLLKKLRLFYNADIIHIHDVFIWVLPFRALFFWKSFYITFHGWEGVYPIPLNSYLQKQMAYKMTKGNISIGKYIEEIYKVKATKISYGGTDCNIIKKVFEKQRRIIFIGRLEEDTGVNILLDALLTLKKKYIVDFYGDGRLRQQCEAVGKVHGFTADIPKILKAADICFCGGYLTALDSLASSVQTCIISHTIARRIIFKSVPFSEFVFFCDTPKEIKTILTAGSIDIQSSKRKQGYLWARKQNWTHVTDQYLNLWKID